MVLDKYYHAPTKVFPLPLPTSPSPSPSPSPTSPPKVMNNTLLRACTVSGGGGGKEAKYKRISFNYQGRGMGAYLAGQAVSEKWGGGG